MIDLYLNSLITFFYRKNLLALQTLFLFFLLLEELLSASSCDALPVELHNLLEKALELPCYEMLEHKLSFDLLLIPRSRNVPNVNEEPI